LRFIGTIDDKGNIKSPHGQEELEEDIVEKVIDVYYHDKLLDFLVKKTQNSKPYQLAESLEIKRKDIEKHKGEALKMVKQDSHPMVQIP